MISLNIYIVSVSSIAIFFLITHIIIIIDNSIKYDNVVKNIISETIPILLFTSLGISSLSGILSYFVTFFIKN